MSKLKVASLSLVAHSKTLKRRGYANSTRFGKLFAHKSGLALSDYRPQR
jgi:hypothetical protein